MRLALWSAALMAIATARADQAVVLKTVSTGPMQYYLSLPNGWSAQKKWPVVVVIESANRQFQNAAEVFAKARGERPFILVTPLVTTNGGANYRQASGYHYDDKAWSEIERVGRCRFDMEGIAAVVADVQRNYGGESKYFISGFEAGGHTLWTVLFRQPQALRAVAAVSTNYAGRCMEDGGFQQGPADLPVRLFAGANEMAGGARSPLVGQTQRAKETAEQHGFRNFSEQVVPGKGHEPLADEVLEYFYSVWRQ
jgi:dienelactone hydrolase